MKIGKQLQVSNILKIFKFTCTNLHLQVEIKMTFLN
jgi:hypothetical protein